MWCNINLLYCVLCKKLVHRSRLFVYVERIFHQCSDFLESASTIQHQSGDTEYLNFVYRPEHLTAVYFSSLFFSMQPSVNLVMPEFLLNQVHLIAQQLFTNLTGFSMFYFVFLLWECFLRHLSLLVPELTFCVCLHSSEESET